MGVLTPLRLLIFSAREGDAESCGNSWDDLLGDSCGLSDCGSVALSGVLVVIGVPVPPSSSVVVMSEGLLSDSDGEIVEQQSFSFSIKRRAVCVENQEDMDYDGKLVKAPPASRRKIVSPTPQQSLQPSIEAMQLPTEVEEQEMKWSTEANIGGRHATERSSREWSSTWARVKA